MDFHFKPRPNGFPDHILRVAPDLLPKGSIRIDSVTIDGQPYDQFDAETLTVTLPKADMPVEVQVRIVPASDLGDFKAWTETDGDIAKVVLSGTLDALAVQVFHHELQKAGDSARVALLMDDLEYLCPEGARVLLLAKQKMDMDEDVYVVGAKGQPKEILERDEFTEEVTMLSSYDKIQKEDE